MQLFITNFKEYYRLLQVVYFSFLQVFLFLMGFVYFQSKESFFEFNFDADGVLIGFILLFLSMLFAFYFYKFLLEKNHVLNGIKQKLKRYAIAFLIKMLILEIGAFLNLFFFVLYANKLFLIFSAILLLAMMMSFPEKNKLKKASIFTEKDIYFINNPDEKLF